MPENTELEKVAKLLKVQFLPPLDPGDAQSLHKALPGYQAIADDTARLVQKHGQTLNLDPAVLADLEQGLSSSASGIICLFPTRLCKQIKLP
uniref:Uncharacterized protein n=1 Tax=Candidatus Kentrum sp. FW TaxID=2126338 RepID=A0A450TPS7_9GAMM|nr:MAG: hypothetical protein BECKFW1821B_GA0114236_11734 [Candidatus Kentron sp. FW]